MKMKLRRIMFVVFVLLLFSLPISIIQNNKIVRAAEYHDAQNVVGLNASLMMGLATSFSNIIYTTYNDTELPKGRWFGTKGEDAAKDIILENLSLWEYEPHEEQIDDTSWFWKKENMENVNEDLIVDHFEISYQNLSQSAATKSITEWSVLPVWPDGMIWKFLSKQTDRLFRYSNTFRIMFSNYMKIFSYWYKDIKEGHNFVDLKVYRRPLNLTDAVKNAMDSINEDIILWQNDSYSIGHILDKVMSQMEQTYNFSFEDLQMNNSNVSKLPWYNTTLYNETEPYVFVGEDYSFNPDGNAFRPYDENREGYYVPIQVEMEIWQTAYPMNKGLILYENQYNSPNETYNFNYRKYLPKPIVYINRSVGKELWNNCEDCDNYSYRVNYSLQQHWDDAIDSYNVYADLNSTTSDDRLILGCLYDSIWGQGSLDSAAGMSIVMAIAKYAKDMETNYGIKPKRDIRFIAWGGEEAGLRGAWSYERKHRGDERKRNLIVLDLNQLGYKQTYPRQSMYVISSATYKNITDNHLNKTSAAICAKTHFTDRTDDYTNLTPIITQHRKEKNTANRWTPPSDYLPLWLRRYLLQHVKTICFIQEHDKQPYAMWRQHHRTGRGYQKGDSMEIYNESFVNITAELVWNVTKYHAYNPNCFINGEPSKELGDSNGDGKKDYITVSFDLDTIMPHERATILGIFKHNKRVVPYAECKNFTFGRDGTSGSLTIRPWVRPNFPKGDYTLTLYLFNSTGQINRELTLFPNAKRNLQKYANETKIIEDIKVDKALSSPDVTKPEATGATNAGTTRTYTTTGTYQTGNQLYYQWEFTNLNTSTTEYTGWLGPYTANQSHSYNYMWTSNGTTQVRVRSRDADILPNDYGNWSEINETEISLGVRFEPPSKVLINTTINVTGIPYGINASNHTWNWYFDNQQEQGDEGQNQTHNYTVAQNNTISLYVNDSEQNTYSYSAPIEVVYLYTTFNATEYTVNTNENITFNSSYFGENPVNSSTWLWNFSDGNISTSRNTTHYFSTPGIYNINLTVQDNKSRETSYITQIIVDDDKPIVISAVYTPQLLKGTDIIEGFYPYNIGIGENITFYVDLYDSKSNYDSCYINITYPDETTTNLSMTDDSSESYHYTLEFNDTDMIGYHSYQIWVTDEANNKNYSTGDHLFEVCHLFGQSNVEKLNVSIEDKLRGTKFTPKENGTADSITAYLQANLTTDPKAICMLYEGSTLIGTTEEKEICTGDNFSWIEFEFSDPKPEIDTDHDYYLTCWGNDICNISYDISSENNGMNWTKAYESPPTPPASIYKLVKNYYAFSIYCSYTNIPEITDVSHTPNTVGFGNNISITANITDSSGLSTVGVSFEYPNASLNIENITMENIENDTYQLVFDDTWWTGQYNYTIWATDVFDNVNNSDKYSFNVSANATISICTIYDEYQNGTLINLTDPPPENPEVTWELLDDGETLHFWNKYDNYYINTSSGIQLTNHKDDYWTHNVLMLGYYQGGEWKKLYRTDELTDFTMDIDDNNSTYLNVTFWKNVMANGYPLRLAIRYHLSGNDNDLTVIPYIKSRAGAVPYQLAFGWELKDIQINMTTADDYIEINGTSYDLDNALNNTYTNLSRPIEWINETTNQSEVIGWEPRPYFYIREDLPDDRSLYLYLKWKESLNYKLQIKSRDGQTNAPVTLFIKVGTLAAGQEKSTELHWYDAEEITYYFNSDDGTNLWNTNPSYMTDGNTETFASTQTDDDNNRCDDNSYNICSQKDETILKVELRVRGYDTGNTKIKLRPRFNGTNGLFYEYSPGSADTWSSWFDITEDEYGPEEWSWNDISTLDCDVVSFIASTLPVPTVYCSQIQVRVTYTVNYAPTISNPVPTSGSDGVVYVPWLSVNVSDANDDTMNVTWITNYSGSWTTFGTNTSVSTGMVMQNYTNATENGKWFYWRVNVSDSETYTLSSIYSFYTGYQSKLSNIGSYNCQGYLILNVQWYNSTSGNWTNILDIIYDSTPRNLSATGVNSTIAFDSLFNGLFNSSTLWEYGNGTYRFYVAFMSPYDEILVTDDERTLEATYEFTITFD